MNGSIVWLSFATVLFVMAYQAIGVLFIGLLPSLREALKQGGCLWYIGSKFHWFYIPHRGHAARGASVSAFISYSLLFQNLCK